MSNVIEKLEFGTSILPLVDIGNYQTRLGDMMEYVPEEEFQSFDEEIKEEASNIVKEIMEEIGCPFIAISEVSIDRPSFYNYRDDELWFTLEFSEDVINHILSYVSEDFYTWIDCKYKSYDGFFSTMPNNKDQFEHALITENRAKAISELVMYIIMVEKCNIETYQEDFLDNMWTICTNNSWYDIEDEDGVFK